MKGESSMSEAIISRRGSNSSGGGKGNLVSEIVVTNTIWTVPTLSNYNVYVMIYGAGGGGFTENSRNKWSGSGGGGGWMNNGVIELNKGELISISIGQGGNYISDSSGDSAGGTTSFGRYLSANGGSSIVFNESMSWEGGGSGGSGGGGFTNGYLGWHFQREMGIGGDGYQFGGGGGFATYYDDGHRSGSNGGVYGGGGGQGFAIEVKTGYISNYASNNQGLGGTYGGNGGRFTPDDGVLYSENGTNTIGNTSVPSSLQGAGLHGGYIKNTTKSSTGYAFGGGGGFGGNGGNPSRVYSIYDNDGLLVYIASGGGGGGYGGRGGNGGNCGCGGGGGYIGKGGDGGNRFGGGGGGYGDGGQWNSAPGYGGGGCNTNPGGNGICIIQYYA